MFSIHQRNKEIQLTLAVTCKQCAKLLSAAFTNQTFKSEEFRDEPEVYVILCFHHSLSSVSVTHHNRFIQAGLHSNIFLKAFLKLSSRKA